MILPTKITRCYYYNIFDRWYTIFSRPYSSNGRAFVTVVVRLSVRRRLLHMMYCET